MEGGAVFDALVRYEPLNFKIAKFEICTHKIRNVPVSHDVKFISSHREQWRH